LFLMKFDGRGWVPFGPVIDPAPAIDCRGAILAAAAPLLSGR
jgi:hypothetical protein